MALRSPASKRVTRRSRTVLLGPQRLQPTIGRVADDLGLTGTVAVVTAGWEERENEDGELTEALGRETINLALLERTKAALAEDRELLEAFEERTNRLRALSELYRLRLDHALDAARELFARQPSKSDPVVLLPERADAVATLAALDRHHLERVREMKAEWTAHWKPAEREAVARRREELAADLAGCSALAIAGGHVRVLLWTLELFDPLADIGRRPVLAWSAGAMALTDRVVLFHDNPPQGRGNPEVLAPGLGRCKGLVLLPHARHRLKLDDPVRVALLARRFAPAPCIALDEDSLVRRSKAGWSGEGAARRLEPGGQVTTLAEVDA